MTRALEPGRSLGSTLLLVLVLVGLAGTPLRAQEAAQSIAARSDLVRSYRTAASEDRRDAEAWAAAAGVPLRVTDSVRVFELVRVDAGRPVYLVSHNADAARTTGTDALLPGGSSGLELTGDGLHIGLWDGGHAYGGHQELVGRVEFGDGAPIEGHASHVAGTLAATGVRAAAMGMAPRSQIRSFDWNADAVEMLEEGGRGLLVSNHSYGPTAGWAFGDLEGRGEQWYWLGDVAFDPREDYTFGHYDRDAARWDRVTWESPYLLPVVSAGNDREDTGPLTGAYRLLDTQSGTYRATTVEERYIPPDGFPDGYDTIAGPALAKNVLTVGAVGDLPSTPGTAPDVSPFSSFGPTDDGRIKPDLVANGDRLLSMGISGSAAYTVLSGTSMAAANCSGSLLLLQELALRQTGKPLRAATLKGLAIHTARDLSLPGPDYQTGWGLLDAKAAADHLQDRLRNPVALVEDSLENGDEWVLRLVKPESGPIRLTLSWSDSPGNSIRPDRVDAPIRQLVRDFDIRLEDLDTGTIWLPYAPDPLHPDRPAGHGDNATDPVERIDLPIASAGSYAVRIGLQAPDSLSGPSRFALLVSGLTDRSRLVAVPRLDILFSEESVLLSWPAIDQVAPGRFILERATWSGAAPPPDSLLNYVPIDSLESPEAFFETRRFELADHTAPPGWLAYRLSFRAGSIPPAVEARGTLFVELAAHGSLQAVSESPEGVAVEVRIDRTRASATFELFRRTLAYDALGEIVLGSAVEVPPSYRVELGQTDRRMVWSDRYIPSGRYRFELRATTDDGRRFDIDHVDTSIPVPRKAALVTLFPVPVRDHLTVIFDNPSTRVVNLSVVDAAGRVVADVHEERLAAGRSQYVLDTSAWAQGVYFLVLQAGSDRSTRSFVRVR